MNLPDALGFTWDRSRIPTSIPVHSIERVCFRVHKMLSEFVWDASVLEGNPFTFPEVQTLLGGVTVGGRRVLDLQQVLNLAESSKRLLSLVRNKQFSLTRSTFAEINGLVALRESLEWGVFRGEGTEIHHTPAVSLGERGRYVPLPTLPGAPDLNRVFREGVEALQDCEPFERGLAFFLFGALQQFFFDGNKRTSRFMMNGVLLSNGMDAISVPANRAFEFNQKMSTFYVTRDATEMMEFLVSCHPEGELLQERSGGAVDEGPVS